MKRLKMLNNCFLYGLNTLRKSIAPFRISQLVCTLLISIMVLSCKSDSTSFTGSNEDNDFPIEEFALTISTTSLPDGEVGIPYSEKLSATGGDGNYTWEIDPDDLPQGLSLNSSTGEISGDPTVDGTFNFTAEVSSAGLTDSKSLSIEMLPPIVVSYRNAVVNVDFMSSILEMAGDEVYVGDDGILSSEDGTFWNPADSDPASQIIGAVDEFGKPTFVDMGLTSSFGSTFIGAANNELQDDGLWSAGIAERGIEWKGLLAENEYDLAFYVYHENSTESNTTLNVTHAGGTITISSSDDATWTLPGEKDQDYLLLENVMPFEISDGVYGFLIDNLNDEGSIVGLQLKGLVPAPEE